MWHNGQIPYQGLKEQAELLQGIVDIALHNHVHVNKESGKLMPRSLSSLQKQDRVIHCQKISQQFVWKEEDFLVIGDETSVRSGIWSGRKRLENGDIPVSQVRRSSENSAEKILASISWDEDGFECRGARLFIASREGKQLSVNTTLICSKGLMRITKKKEEACW